MTIFQALRCEVDTSISVFAGMKNTTIDNFTNWQRLHLSLDEKWETCSFGHDAEVTLALCGFTESMMMMMMMMTTM